MFNKILKSIALFFAMTSVLILVTAYLQQSFNPDQWSEIAKATFGVICFFIGFASIALSLSFEDTKPPHTSIFLLFAFCLLLSCTGKTKVVEAPQNATLTLIAERDGCQLYYVKYEDDFKMSGMWTICKDRSTALSGF